MIRRAEIRRQLRIAQQLKVATLVVVAILLLAAYPIYLMTRSATLDPVFGDLDALHLPEWADLQHSDAARGNLWCVRQCRSWDRTWASERTTEETYDAYDAALRDTGWRPREAGICPQVQEGKASCWQRDDYVMDMWVRVPICDVPPARPSASPSVAVEASPGPSLACPGSLVTMRVFNAVDYDSGS